MKYYAVVTATLILMTGSLQVQAGQIVIEANASLGSYSDNASLNASASASAFPNPATATASTSALTSCPGSSELPCNASAGARSYALISYLILVDLLPGVWSLPEGGVTLYADWYLEAHAWADAPAPLGSNNTNASSRATVNFVRSGGATQNITRSIDAATSSNRVGGVFEGTEEFTFRADQGLRLTTILTARSRSDALSRMPENNIGAALGSSTAYAVADPVFYLAPEVSDFFSISIEQFEASSLNDELIIGFPPMSEPPVSSVPITGTLPLLLSGLAAVIVLRRRT